MMLSSPVVVGLVSLGATPHLGSQPKVALTQMRDQARGSYLSTGSVIPA